MPASSAQVIGDDLVLNTGGKVKNMTAGGSAGEAVEYSQFTGRRLDQIAAPTAAVGLNSQKITALANGSAATDAAAFGQVPVVAAAAPLAALAPAALGASAKFATEDHRHLPPLSNRVVFAFEDFQYFVSSAAGSAVQMIPSGLYVQSTTAGGTTQNPGSAAEVGIAVMSTGTSTTGKALISGAFNASPKMPYALATANALYVSVKIAFTTLSDGTNTYIGRAGLTNSYDVVSTDGVFFDYVQATDTHWICTTRASSTSTTTVTTVTVTAGSFNHLEIVKDAGSSNYKFYIDGVLVATQSTNVPSTQLDILTGAVKSAGATARTVATDWINVYEFFASPRNSAAA